MTSGETLALLQILLDGKSWTSGEAGRFFSAVVAGGMEPELLSAALSAFRLRGQTVDELTGAALALLDSAVPFPRPDAEFADIVGTGGDGQNTLNLSTIAAITAAACGCRLVKHGNRSVSSSSGSFDLLESLGVPFEVDAGTSRQQLDRHGICFLYAPRYHPGLRHAAPVRKLLRVRTIFNLLGPLVNPSRPSRILLGVADPQLLGPMAGAVQALGCTTGFVVHGGGVDEVAVHAPTEVVQVGADGLTRFVVSPADFGARRYPLEELVSHDAAESHARSRRVLDGMGSDAENTAVCLNVAMVMKLFGHGDLRENFGRSMEGLRGGAAGRLVQALAGGG